ncbi:hypothetical protein Zm00014a_001409 [Zea mays]|uniref:Uncharacterized protein n=1 Tax=Zea mays TaxID=4577 RepID=A0A3L6D7A4_MAIZE|nr:hypothetical protein Zm00014a_001409 [Zea mays]
MAQARAAALESHEVIAVEALKQAKDEHIQKLVEAYLVTHNQRRAMWIQDPASSNPVQPMRDEEPQILEGLPISIEGERKAWELPEGAIVLEGMPVSPQVKEEAASTPPAPSPSEVTLELQEPVPLGEEFDSILPSQSPPEEVINISSLLTHPGDVSD